MTSRMTRAPIAPITLALSLAATMATAQPATYKIAFIDPLFGPFADVGELMLMLMLMQYAIRNTQYAIDDISAKGGMRGSTQLQLLQFDSLSDIARNHGEDGAAWMTAMLAPKRNVLHVWASH